MSALRKYYSCERLPENVSEFARAAVPAYRLKTALNKSAQRESIGKRWTNGCNARQSYHLPDGDICSCIGHRSGGVCFRIGRRRRLAPYPHADPDRNIDHRLRSRRAGGFGLEITACVAMASAMAVLIRCGPWCAFGRCDSRLDPA